MSKAGRFVPDMMYIPSVNGSTSVFGIIGHPVSQSMSPVIHNAAFQACKFNGIYVPFDVKRAGVSLKKALLDLNIQGASVTIPHKTWACRIADRRDALSEICGASNTLRIKDGQIHAFNTDGPGAIRALQQGGFPTKGRRYLILGYGGSAAAIAGTLLLEENPSWVGITGRNRTKVKNFVKFLGTKIPKKKSTVQTVDLGSIDAESFDAIINTTPLGMTGKPDLLPVDLELIGRSHTVFDIVYNPIHTQLLKASAEKGAKTISGYLMLLYQAVLQFEIFTGLKAPEHLMEKELLGALRKTGDGK